MASGTTAVAVNAGGGTAVSVGSGVEVNDGSPFPLQALTIITTIIKHMTNLGRTNVLQKLRLNELYTLAETKNPALLNTGFFTQGISRLT